MSSDEEEETGFGEDFDEDEEESFGAGFDEEDEEDEEVDEDMEFGNADDDEDDEDEEDAAPALPPIEKQKEPGEAFKAFGKKYFKGQSATYTINPIVTPLLNIENPKLAQTAIDVFKLVCQFMGITAVVGKSKLTPLQGVHKIVKAALTDEGMKDELYCQIMKQWTDNPSMHSRARGTILMGLCLGTFAPSTKLIPVLRQFILDGPQGFIPFMNMLLRRTLHNGVRIQPPCQLELQAVKKKQIMRINVVIDLCTGDTATARLDPASTSAEWVSEIANQIGMKDTYGWSIFMDRFGKLVSLRGHGKKGQHIMDAISLCDQEMAKKGVNQNVLSVTGQFSFRKELFLPTHNCLKDPVSTHIIHHQIQYLMKRQLLKCPKQEDYNVLAAQMYYSLYGDDLDTGRLTSCLQAWIPDSELERQKIKERIPLIEKYHAKSDYSRQSFNQTQTEELVVKYAMNTWGKKESFSSEGAIALR